MRNTFRVVIPRKIDFFLILFKNILDKHAADGVNSPLSVLNMADAQVKYAHAFQKHLEAEQLSKDAETATELRNVLLGMGRSQLSSQPNTLLYLTLSVRNVLLGVRKGAEPALGEWGFDVRANQKGSYRVYIPYRKPLLLLVLAEKVLAKHLLDGVDSPLVGIDMSAFATLLNNAKAEHAKSEQLHKFKEIAYKERNIALGIGKKSNSNISGSLHYYVRAVRNTLTGIYRGSEQTLGDWGFEVNRS
jgi:hypothetical protein